MTGTGSRLEIQTALMLILLMIIPVLSGCHEKPDILGQEPVIPLVESTVSENSGDTEDKDKGDSDNKSDSDKKSDSDIKDAVDDDTGYGMNPDFPELHVEGEYEEYEVSGVQLSEDQLDKLSSFFNLKDVNPYLAQVYLIPQDFDETLETEPVNITCIGGSYDSNRLYSVFYKKEGSNALWNVVMRRNSEGEDMSEEPDTDEEEAEYDEDGRAVEEKNENEGTAKSAADDEWGIKVGAYRFHSNQMLADEKSNEDN